MALDKKRMELNDADAQKQNEKDEVKTPGLLQDQLEKLEQAKILCTNDMFLKILEIDDSFQRLEDLPERKDLVEQYNGAIVEETETFQKVMIDLNDKMNGTKKYCIEILQKAELDSEKVSISTVDGLKQKLKTVFKRISGMDETDPDLDPLEKEIVEEVEKLEDRLMEIEMNLVEALAEATGIFSNKVQDILQDMNNKTVEFIQKVTTSVTNFQNDLKEHANKQFDAFQRVIENNDEAEMEYWQSDDKQNLLMLLEDKDMMNQYFEQSKDFQEGKIQEKESEITRALQDDWKNTYSQIEKDQHQRNRNIIKEIIEMKQEYLDKIEQEFKKIRREEDYY